MLYKPRSHRNSELKRAGVKIRWKFDDGKLTGTPHLTCECGATWEAEFYNERLSRGYWKCPRGCNKEAR